MIQISMNFFFWILLILSTTHLCSAILKCGHCVHSLGQTLYCPNSNSIDTQYKVELKNRSPTVYLLLSCSPISKMNLTLLEGCSFPDVNFVEFKLCPLSNETFQGSFKQIGIHPSKVEKFRFYHPLFGESYMHSEHLVGLTNLVYLDIENAKLSGISSKLFQYTPNLKTLYIRNNNLTSLPENIFENLNSLTILNLSSNILLSIPKNLLNGLISLEVIYFWNNNLQFIPSDLFDDNPNLKNISFLTNEIQTLNENLFSQNPNLISLNFKNNKLQVLPPNLFSNNPNLTELNFERNNLKTLPVTLFHTSKLLKIINFSFNELSSIPENFLNKMSSLQFLDLSKNFLNETIIKANFFNSATNLKLINLSLNNFTNLPDNIFTLCHLLEELDVSHNKLSKLSFNSFPVSGSSSLKDLNLSHNELNSTNIGTIVFALNTQVNLENLDFSYNLFHHFPSIAGYNFVKLKTLNFEGNQIKRVTLATLFELRRDILINLKNNQIETISNTLYNHMEEKIIYVKFAGNNLTCDCQIFNAIEDILQNGPKKAVLSRNEYLSVDKENKGSSIHILDRNDVVCERPKYMYNRTITDIQLIELQCKMPMNHCSSECPCSYRQFDKLVTVHCHGQQLDSLPKVIFNPNLHYSLDLSSNLISSFNISSNNLIVNLSLYNNNINFEEFNGNGTVLPPSLKFLDLRNNNLVSIPESFAIELNNSEAIIDLSENPWKCNCAIKFLHNLIQARYDKIENLRNIKCTGVDGVDRILVDMTEEDICPLLLQPFVIATIGIVTMLLVILAILGTVVFFRNKTRIMVWLFTHRLCLWLVTEDEIDSNKQYDAFISYSHKDEEFINSILVPGLENGDPKYRVCLHYRDWIVGEFIQNQIMNSVRNSRRTIVVLSTNFIESVWGQMEFRAAHQQALEDNTNRVIVIVYGEIPSEENIDIELKHYISLHTYLEWGNPRFWENLRYAMPHPQHLVPRSKRKRRDTDKLELVNGLSKPDITT